MGTLKIHLMQKRVCVCVCVCACVRVCARACACACVCTHARRLNSTAAHTSPMFVFAQKNDTTKTMQKKKNEAQKTEQNIYTGRRSDLVCF